MVKLKILCVDEDKETADQLRQRFESLGLTINAVHATLDAIEELERNLDYNLMISDFKLTEGTVEPIFWHLSVNNYSLSSIIYSAYDPAEIRSQISYPDLITLIQKPQIERLCECVFKFSKILAQSTNSST